MAFRADEAAKAGFEELEQYLVPHPRDADEKTRSKSKAKLREIVAELGPVVKSYPTWHPLVRHHDSRNPESTPGERCGYEGLDHTRFFVNGFITCPYDHDNGVRVFESVEKLAYKHHSATITAERLDVQFYARNAVPILIRCNWTKAIPQDGTIPLAIAMPLLLETELACAEWSSIAETWETMKPYFLGNPHGSRSSLFVNQETGQAMKKMWQGLIQTGMFGPVRE
jgi:hypothetical protein